MAYVGETEKLCQAIVSEDLETVKACLAEEDTNPDHRDYTGRTPLQLACMSSTPDVVQCIVDHGARLIARMADGRTALHIAAARGDLDIIRVLLIKSNQNEEANGKAGMKTPQTQGDTGLSNENNEMRDAEDASWTSASFTKIDYPASLDNDTPVPTENKDSEPDVFDINATSWDSFTSPLHLAILHGHSTVVNELVTAFGADVLQPVRILHDDGSPKSTILNLALVSFLSLERAILMSKALLDVGASLAQADRDQNTALDFIAQSNYTELIDIYQKNDEPALQQAISHMKIDANHFYNPFVTSLIHAICAKNNRSAQKLLQAGAKPKFEREDFVRAMKPHLSKANIRSQEDGDDFIRRRGKQPILFAVENQLPSVAIELLRRGADPNSEFERSWGSSQYTVLDQVRDSVKELQAYLKENDPASLEEDLENPLILETSDDDYLKDFKPGSYKLFSARTQLQDAHSQLEEAKRNKEENDQENHRQCHRLGLEEEKCFIQELIHEYALLEEELLKLDAKTFKELHPDNSSDTSESSRSCSPSNSSDEQKFNFNFNFRAPLLTDDVKGGYLELFEAAWNGDIDTIKKLTLGMWGASHSQSPLEISICDREGFSCLSISILRGHLQVAEAILEIIEAQYQSPTGTEEKFEMCSDEDSNNEPDDSLNIVGRDISDQEITYQNVGQIVTDVQSSTSPLVALETRLEIHRFADQECKESTGENVYTLFKYAIVKGNVSLLDFLLEARNQCMKFATDYDSMALRRSLRDEFHLAISLGQVDCLTILIQKTGIGLPLMQLGDESGIKLAEKYEHYPGLSIRGKKRKDWASAGRGQTESSDPEKTPPLIIAARKGSLKMVEWFLSTAPSHHYMEYANSHIENENVQRLAQSKLGLEGSVLNFLKTNGKGETS